MLTSTNNSFSLTTSSIGAGPFTFPIAIHSADDLKVYVNGALVPASGGSNPHTIIIAANKQSAEITFSSNLASDTVLKFIRSVSYKQETNLSNNSLFDAESLETSLDNIVMQVQQIGNVVTSTSESRTLGFDSGIDDWHDTSATATTITASKANRSNKALAFDANGDITVSSDDIGSTIDWQLEAEEWASLASGNVYSYSGGSRDADQGSISAKAQATAAAASASSAATDLAAFQTLYRGSSGSTPSNPADGHLWFDTNSNVMKVYNSTSSAWEQLTPTSTNQTNINLVAADAVDIGKVAAKDVQIGQLAVLGTAGADISTVAAIGNNGADVSTVAAITAGDVSKVANVDGEVEDVAAIDTEITTLINGTDGTTGTGGTTKNIALVNSVHGKITEVGNLGTSTVVGYMTALNATNVISHMAALNATNVITNIGLVAAIDDKVTDVAAIDDKVEDVAAIDGEVVTVAGLNTEIAALGASAVVTYITNLNASGVITNMAALNASGVIADIGTVAGMDGEVNSFANRYRVANSAPQSSLDQGDLYFNTFENALYTYGTEWQLAAPSASDQANINIVAGELTYEEDLGLITATPTTSSGNDIDTVAGLNTEIGLLAAKVTEMGRLGTAEIAGASTGALARLGTAAVVEDIGYLGTQANVLAMGELGTSTVVGHIAALNGSGVITNIGTVATSIADVNRYATEYIISSSEPSSPTPTEGDLWYDSINNVLKYHNGTSFASISAELHNEVAQDTTPTLGGNLDADDNDITNMGNIDGTNLNIDFGSI